MTDHDWPHAPLHRINQKGTYIVTAATIEKQHHFKTVDRLNFLQDSILKLSMKYGWQLQAWAVFSNQYHFVAQSSEHPENLRVFLSNLHVTTARYVNLQDQATNRQVWFQFWDTQITYQPSYLARLNYVIQNPVRHGLVKYAKDYEWCSANWFERNTSSAFYKSVLRFKTDTVNVQDDFF